MKIFSLNIELNRVLRKLLVLSIFILFGVEYFAQPIDNYLQNPNMISINKVEPNVKVIPSQDVKSALTKSFQESKYYKSLNGTWEFNWVTNPNSRSKKFYDDSFNKSEWDEIMVPSFWSC